MTQTLPCRHCSCHMLEWKASALNVLVIGHPSSRLPACLWVGEQIEDWGTPCFANSSIREAALGCLAACTLIADLQACCQYMTPVNAHSRSTGRSFEPGAGIQWQSQNVGAAVWLSKFESIDGARLFTCVDWNIQGCCMPNISILQRCACSTPPASVLQRGEMNHSKSSSS